MPTDDQKVNPPKSPLIDTSVSDESDRIDLLDVDHTGPQESEDQPDTRTTSDSGEK